MNEVLHLTCHAVTLLGSLFGNLIADGPHHDGGMETVGKHQILEVAPPPILIETTVAVLAFRPLPHVETLCHHHHTEGVIDFHLHLRGCVVRGAYGVTSHAFQQLHLTDEGCLVDCCANHAEVMMQTDAFNFSGFSIQHETAIRCHFYSSDAILHGLLVNHFAVVVNETDGQII